MSTEAVSEILNTKTLNTNSDSDNKIKNTNTKTLKTVSEVRLIAQRLSDELNNPSRFEYYCKIAWKLPENLIWNNLEAAQKGREPQRLFSFLCQQSLK